LASVVLNTYLGNIKMEIFILIGVVLVGLVVLLWFKTKKTTVVKAEEPVVAQAEVAPVVVKEEPVVAQAEVAPVVVKEEPVLQEKVEQVESVTVIDEVVPEVVKPAKKPKAKKPSVSQPTAPKPKRTRKPKA
jgi:hypothetical protein